MAEDHLEIERAWILTEMPPAELITHNIPHLISYLFSGKEGELRIVSREHKVDNGMPADVTKHSITVKSGNVGLTRNEWEDDDFPEWAWKIMLNQTIASIKKTRYFVNYDNHKLEIDKYHYRMANGEGGDDIRNKLRLECEFKSEEEANEFELPDWAKGSKEITGLGVEWGLDSD